MYLETHNNCSNWNLLKLIILLINFPSIIKVHVNHPLDVDEIFDDISYNKGASLIRMVYRYIGEDVSVLLLLHFGCGKQVLVR